MRHFHWSRRHHENLVCHFCCRRLGARRCHARRPKGCLKGAVVGGVAGHYAGHHGVLGAAAGCLYGRHRAKEQERQQQQSQGQRGQGEKL